MAPDTETDGSDYKPFFDMIVGVLFILLILISAQMFFAQRSMEDNADADNTALERNKQISSFLENVADRLRMGGFEPDVDLVRRRLTLALDQVSTPAMGGIPTFSDQRVGAVGQILSDRLGCIFPGPLHPSDCMDWKLIKLGEVQVELRAGSLPPESTLPSDRFTQLATTLFSAKLLSGRPDLLSLTGTAGTPLFHFQPLLPLSPGLAGPSGLVQFSFIFDK